MPLFTFHIRMWTGIAIGMLAALCLGEHPYATATEVAVGDVLPAAMYTEGNNLIINSPPDGDVVFNGKSCRDLAVSVKAASSCDCAKVDELAAKSNDLHTQVKALQAEMKLVQDQLMTTTTTTTTSTVTTTTTTMTTTTATSTTTTTTPAPFFEAAAQRQVPACLCVCTTHLSLRCHFRHR